MADLDYLIVVGRFGLVVGDGGDEDTDPEIVWCTGGKVALTPVNTYTKVSGGSPTPWTAADAVIEAPFDSSGYIGRSGSRTVKVVDLTSPKVNPRVETGATYLVRFVDVTAPTTPDITKVTYPPASIRIAPDTAVAVTGSEAAALGVPDGTMVCDLTRLMPVPTAGGTPIIQGQQGYSIGSVEVVGDALIAKLNDPDQTELEPTALPVTMIDNMALIQDTVTDDINTPGTDINEALNASYAAFMPKYADQAAAEVGLGDDDFPDGTILVVGYE